MLNDECCMASCTNLEQIDPTYYQLESNGNVNFEQITFDCPDIMNSEKLSLSSMDYLLPIDDTDDFFEFIKSEETVDLCRSVNDQLEKTIDCQTLPPFVATCQTEAKPNKVNKSKCKLF